MSDGVRRGSGSERLGVGKGWPVQGGEPCPGPGREPWPPEAGAATGWRVGVPRVGLASGWLPLSSLPATGADLGLGVGVGGVDQRLAALVAVGPTTARGIPIDAALGAAGRVLAAVGVLAHQAADGLLALLLLFGLGSGLGGGFLGGAFGVERGLLGVAGLLLEEKESLAHGEGLAPVARGQRAEVSLPLAASE